MLEVAGQSSQTNYHSISGEILPHIYVKNIFLDQKLTKLEQFKENLSNFQKEIAQTFNKKLLYGLWSILDPFTYRIQSTCLLISK